MRYEDENYLLPSVTMKMIFLLRIDYQSSVSRQHCECCIVGPLDCSMTARISLRKGLNGLHNPL